MNGISMKILFPMLIGLAMLLSGCAVDNKVLAKFPLMEMKSDHIPGLDSPRERTKLIREKGTKGATAPDSEREILAAQLVHEYQTSPDPNMRREAVDALAKIPHPQRDRFLREILQDPNPFVRMSALEALGKTYSGSKAELSALLINRMKTDEDKDVRLAAVRILGNVFPQNASNDAREIVLELGNLLRDRVPAVRYEAMGALQKVTGKDYGTDDINRWLEYIRYVQGEIPTAPAERTFSEKLPSISLPMLR